MRNLHVFDMDGTLLVGSACLEISRTVGVLDETLAIECAWARGDLSDNGFWQQCLPLWAGLTDAQIDAAFAGSPWLQGVQAVFADIRARHEASVVITQSPTFFVQRLTRWGVHFVHGALVEPGNAAGAERLVSAADKLAVTERLLGELRLSRDECVAYGDSGSDLALFEALPLTVAVNAKERIRALARTTYDGSDLWQAYCAGRQLLDARRVRDRETQDQGVSR